LSFMGLLIERDKDRLLHLILQHEVWNLTIEMHLDAVISHTG